MSTNPIEDNESRRMTAVTLAANMIATLSRGSRCSGRLVEIRPGYWGSRYTGDTDQSSDIVGLVGLQLFHGLILEDVAVDCIAAMRAEQGLRVDRDEIEKEVYEAADLLSPYAGLLAVVTDYLMRRSAISGARIRQMHSRIVMSKRV